MKVRSPSLDCWTIGAVALLLLSVAAGSADAVGARLAEPALLCASALFVIVRLCSSMGRRDA